MQLHFESTGTGDPVVILHGLFGSLENWGVVARALSSNYRVLAVDQRNHGRSPHDLQMNYPLMAQDVRDLLDQQGLGVAHVIGHSMGGKTAMQLAVDYPDHVRSLVVVDIAPKQYPRAHDYILEALLALDLARYSARHELEQALAPRIPDSDVRRFLLKSVVRNAEGGFAWRMGLREINENYDALGAAISSDQSYSGSCMFIRGGQSDYIQPADEPAIRQIFPTTVVKTIPGAGHWVHVEKSKEFLEATLNFLSSL